MPAASKQPAVAKAALTAIRDALKARHLKAREAAARARMKAKTKAPVRRKAKAVAAVKPVAGKA